MLTLPLSARAGLDPDPRIIDNAAWAKLMAAGLTLTSDDMLAYGSPAAKAAGWHANYYPIEMIRALVGVWLFGGLRMDGIRRLELDCVRWDQADDPDSGQTYRVCLLHIPANKTSGAFSKPVDPVVGGLIDAWRSVRPAQPDIVDRKTGQRRQHLFCYRAQLIGPAYLDAKLIRSCAPRAASPNPTPAERSPATAPAPPSPPNSSTPRNRCPLPTCSNGSILTGAASGDEPWKYYDLGEGYRSYG